jgi:hypothetical protein
VAAEGADVLRLGALLGALLAASALVLGACGGGGDQQQKSASVDAKRVLASAPQKAANAGSSKVSFSYTIDSEALSRPITTTGEGEFDYARREGRLTFDVGDLLAAAGQSSVGGTIELIANGDIYYMKYPLLSRSVGAKTPWVKFDLGKLEALSGVDLSSLQQVSQSDPSQTLVYLRAAGTVDEVGSEQVDGVDTTKYRATIDLARVADLAPPNVRQAVRDSIANLRKQAGLSELPLDVWIDRDGLPRTLAYEVDTQASGKTVKSSVALNFSDYGVAVDAEPPPAGQVTDISELAG